MSLGILTSTIQTVKSLKDHEYIQRLQDFAKRFSDEENSDYSHVTKRKSRAQLLRLSAAVCGIELCYAAETAFVSPILLKLGVPVAFMTLVWCVSPLLGFFLVPLLGSLSDRCPARLGRRRPFILILSVGIVVGLILVPNGESLGSVIGDEGTRRGYGNETPPIITQINSTSKLVIYHNGSREVLRSDFLPEWPAVRLPHNHVAGIILTILGVAMLDFNCDACQSPCRTYLLDISVPEDHPRGLTSFTVMAGIGGSIGYLMGGVNWEATSFGTALGGHVRVVFSTVLILFVISVCLTLTSFKEIPLKELGSSAETHQKRVKRVKKAKYKKFVNESSEEDEAVAEATGTGNGQVSYGTLSDPTNNGFPGQPDPDDETQEIAMPSETTTGSVVENGWEDFTNLLPEVSLKTYLKSIIKMPRSLMVLCLTNLFCWMSLVCYSLYFTDFVGQYVFRGNPSAPIGSREHILYDEGVRLGSFGMSVYSLSCAVYSLAVERLVERFGAKPVYICGQLAYTVGMVILSLCRHPVAVILLSPFAGIMYATLFTMPYLLVAHYHSNKQFSEKPAERSTDGSDIRGLGTDIALVSSMVFLAQFLLSLFMGSLVHLAGSTVTIVIAAAILSFLGALSATQVTYLNL